MTLARQIQAVNNLQFYSSQKHLLILLLARQEAGETEWPGQEALSIDSSIPKDLVSKSVLFLRSQRLLKLVRTLDNVYTFKINLEVLEFLGFGKAA
jgi:hypothetical protein